MPILLLACAATGYDPVALVMLVDAPLPAEAATVHVCVEGFGEMSFGAGNGRVAFTGIPTGIEVTATVDVLDIDSEVLGAATRTVVPGASTVADLLAPFLPADAPCADPGDRATADEAGGVLGIRFAEPSWS